MHYQSYKNAPYELDQGTKNISQTDELCERSQYILMASMCPGISWPLPFDQPKAARPSHSYKMLLPHPDPTRPPVPLYGAASMTGCDH